MKFLSTTVAVLVLLLPMHSFAQDDDKVNLSKEAGAACEVCLDKYPKLKDKAQKLENTYNKRVGQLDECRQTLRIQSRQLEYQGRDIGRLKAEKSNKVPKWQLWLSFGLSSALIAGWIVDKSN